jgi:hypothetical protein
VIVCRKCSRRYPEGREFCSCGAYLAFDGEHVADPIETGQLTPPSTPPTRAPDSIESTPARWSGLPGEPPLAGQQSAPGVDARLPDVPIGADNSERVWVESTGRAGDVRCRRCSTPNPPTLQFCRHCGVPLQAAMTAASVRSTDTIPWWRRWLGQARRNAGRVDATTMANSALRFPRAGVVGRVIMFRTGIVATIVLGLFAFRGPLHGPVRDGVRGLLGGERFDEVDASVSPVETTPAGSAPPDQHGVSNLVDGYANTTWATRWLAVEEPGTVAVPDDGACVVGARSDSAVRFEFDEPTDLEQIAILGGRHAEDKSAGPFSRPRLIELEVDGRCQHIELVSEGALEIHGFHHSDVPAVVLRVVDVVAEPEQAPTVEIAEVIFGKK